MTYIPVNITNRKEYIVNFSNPTTTSMFSYNSTGSRAYLNSSVLSVTNASQNSTAKIVKNNLDFTFDPTSIPYTTSSNPDLGLYHVKYYLELEGSSDYINPSVPSISSAYSYFSELSLGGYSCRHKHNERHASNRFNNTWINVTNNFNSHVPTFKFEEKFRKSIDLGNVSFWEISHTIESNQYLTIYTEKLPGLTFTPLNTSGSAVNLSGFSVKSLTFAITQFDRNSKDIIRLFN